MRILHPQTGTGSKFLQQSRAAEHEAFLNWLLRRPQAHEVDAIIVAGDILIPDRRRAMRELYKPFCGQPPANRLSP